MTIAPPEGMHPTEMGPGLLADGDVVRYRGAPGSDVDLWVRFRPDLPVRVWRDLTRFLASPI